MDQQRFTFEVGAFIVSHEVERPDVGGCFLDVRGRLGSGVLGAARRGEDTYQAAGTEERAEEGFVHGSMGLKVQKL